MSKFKEILIEIKNYDREKDHWGFGDEYKKKFIKSINDFTPEEKERIGDILIATIRSRCKNMCNSVYGPILEKRKLVDWKKKPELIENIFSAIIEECESSEKRIYYTDFVEKLVTLIVSNQIFDRHHATIFSIISKSFSRCDEPDHSIHSAALHCITKFPWKNYSGLVVEAARLVCSAVQAYPDTNENDWVVSNISCFIAISFRGLNGSSIHQILVDDMTKLLKFCADQDWQYSEDPSRKNICYKVLLAILEDFLNNGNVPVEAIKPMYPTILELRESGDECVVRDAGYIVSTMAGNSELNSHQTPQLLQEYLQNKIQIGDKIPEMYKSYPDAFYPLLSQFEQKVDENYPYIYFITQLFTEIAKTKPEEISDSVCDKIVKLLPHATAKYQSIMFFEALAISRPYMAAKYEQELMKCMNSDQVSISMVCPILAKMADDDAKCGRFLNEMVSRAKTLTSEPNYIISVVYNIRLIGLKNPQLLAKHRQFLEELKQTPALKDICQSALDLIEGRSLENISKEVTEQRKDIIEIDSRLTENEIIIDELENRVDNSEDQLINVSNQVINQIDRFNDLENVVNETVEKVDDLDHKTLSHAPTWSRDAAILLNKKQDNDWKLLAFRMGYNAEDIRNWATQPNPCLSLFDEWYATHMTREATYAVVRMLNEMERNDAAQIVQHALDAVADVVKEDEPEPLHPPPVFLSYQWAHQNEVRLLKKHLEMAGYACWMDIGQMGGGDKLFSKIDAGMRAAKVVISCVTQRYAESPNCNREVNLSVTLGKPIIPLLMEKMPWPPIGSMGPIFGEYLFVRFYKRPEEVSDDHDDDRFWPVDLFGQLLMQIRYNVAPNESIIQLDSPYKAWWKPKEEIIVLKKKKVPTATLR